MHIERDDTPQQEDGDQPCTPVSRFTPLVVTAKDAIDASQRQQQQQQQQQQGPAASPKDLKRKPTGQEAIIVAAEKKAKREAVKAAAKRAKVHVVDDGPAPAVAVKGGGLKAASQDFIAAKAREARNSSPSLLSLLGASGSKSSSLATKSAASSAKPATSAHGATDSGAIIAETAAAAGGSSSGREKKKKAGVTPGAHTSGYPALSTSLPPTIEDARFSLRIVRGIMTTFNDIEDKAAAQGVSFIKAAPCEEWLDINVAYVEEVLKRFRGEVAERNEVFKHLGVVAELAQQALRGVKEGEG